MSALTASTRAPLGRDLADDLSITALHLARRIANGATLWCVAPTAPAHAAHLAVEFLHPVIMGKRAVPAVALEGDHVRASLRSATRAGDVLLLLGSSREPELLGIARRAAPWGCSTVWFVTDTDPERVDADHVLHVGPGSDSTDHDATVELVLAYHLLWELTHVVFEHPGLLRADADADPPVCVTCADEALLGEVLTVDREQARVRIDGASVSVATNLVDELGAGDLVLVHAGVAIARVEDVP
jgi:hypothetical protein